VTDIDVDTNGNGNGSGRLPPHDLKLETGLLGLCMLRPSLVEECIDLVAAADFYAPGNGHVWESICRLHEASAVPDAQLVADDLRRLDRLDNVGGPAEILSMVANAPASMTVSNYAQRVAEMAGMRRLVLVADGLKEAALSDHDLGPAGLIDLAHTRLDGLDMGVGVLPDSFVGNLDEFMNRPAEERRPWVIPGQLREGHRIVFVASEGAGKSVLLRQMAICASQGVNPFMPQKRIKPVRALIIDLENPDDAIDDQINMILGPLQRAVSGEDWDPSRVGLLREPGGLNLRARRDRAMIDSVLHSFRPDIVVAGPAYKMYELDGDRHEICVHEIQRAWDKWRTRFGFALVLEHHAPMSTGEGRGRTIRPSDTMLWLRWPEFGIALTQDKSHGAEDNSFKFGRWRGDRVKVDLPTKMMRGRQGELPWVFSWPTGTFKPDPDRDGSSVEQPF
jgi:replicative DNA helicase